MYNHNFVIGVTCFKSHIQRAKCARYNLYHYDIVPVEEREKDIEKIVSLLSKIIGVYSKWKSNELNIRLHITFNRKEVYENANNQLYERECPIYSHLDRHTYSSIEGFIRDIINCMKIADPTIVLSEKEVFNNPSIKAMIRHWYNHTVGEF